MNNTKKGVFCILCAAFFFASMNVCVKLAGNLPSIQKSFFRNLIAALFALIILLKNKEEISYQKKDLPMLLLRSVFGTIGILCNFYAVDHLLVSDASMLNKLSPFFVIIFSSLFLKEKANFIQKLTIVIAFIGSLFVIKPSINFVSNMNSFIGVMGAMTAGIAYTCVRQLGKQGVVGAKIVFFFSCFSCLSVVPYLFFNYQPMSMQQVFYLLMAGLMAAGGQFSITSAYTYAPAKEISVYDYTQVLFAAVLGFVFLKQVPDVYSLVGYVIIIGVAFWNFQRQKKIQN
ncbi:DMT family transporter [Coprobacillus sp. AF21-8LB]|nr:DMT family transporter [Coprobacillus sp. AF21-8LB]